MKNKLKYFGLYENSFEFNKLSEKEQHHNLINDKVYIEGNRKEIYDDDFRDPYYLNEKHLILYLGKDFLFQKKNYTLSPNFINEVYDEVIEVFKNDRLKLINDQINLLTLTYQLLEDEIEKSNFLNEKTKNVKTDYIKELSKKIFQDFHNQKSIPNFKEIVIKKHITYDVKHLSDYLFGLNNLQNFNAISCFYNFCRLNEITNFCNQHLSVNQETNLENIDFTNPSIPKSIALLKASGFFELEKIKKLKPTRLYQIIAIIIGKHPNNVTDNRSIRGNYNVMNKNSDENITNYTSNSHLKSMEDLLK